MARDARLLSRAERYAPWLAGLVLVAGVAAYTAVHFTGGSTPKPPPHVRSTLLPVERRIALEFVHTAVARKNLARAWDIAAPELKGGTTREEWLAGTMPVVPYPVAKANVALRVVDSFEDVAHLNVVFTPKPGTDASQQTFELDLRNDGKRWLVSVWQPAATIRPRSGGK